MSFVGSMFSSSNGSGFNAGANQGSALGQASAQQAQTLQGVQNQFQNEAVNGSPLAQAQLQQATNANIANQAGLISSQKGLNPALAARQASQNAGQIGQQAANQSAQTQAQIQLAAQQNLANSALQQQGIYQGALANQNNAQESIAQTNAQGQQNILGGFLGSAGLSGFKASQAYGGMVGNYATGGQVNGQPSHSGGISSMVPSFASQFLSQAPEAGPALLAARGGQVPAMVSPGEGYLAPSKVKEVAHGKNPLSIAERIPGKPNVPGNSYANDTVPKNLKSGGIVIPNSIMQSRDPAKQAANFVAAILAKQGGSLHAKR